MAHKGMPHPDVVTFTKAELLRSLVRVDKSPASSKRVLAMETEFRTRIKNHVQALPTSDAKFSKFFTSPFVLMFYALQNGLQRIGEIEQVILPAKVFSSMETSAGRMVESVALPKYGWEIVPSQMHSSYSAVDGKRTVRDTLFLATLKSGPRCLNDEMSENFADAILGNCLTWAKDAGVKKIDFTYGVLYGTRKQSNKKDWHILRNIAEKFPSGIVESPENMWHCRFKKNGVDVTVTVRIGADLWTHVAGHDDALMELCTSLLRACIKLPAAGRVKHNYVISDLADIVSLRGIDERFNAKIIQRSQLEWLFFFARHFCDDITAGDLGSIRHGW